jgi:hypothetical protein
MEVREEIHREFWKPIYLCLMETDKLQMNTKEKSDIQNITFEHITNCLNSLQTFPSKWSISLRIVRLGSGSIQVVTETSR